ncbi:MAG: hypothetical protein A2638_05230 [Nitrospirae bacterium RIFCSPHIGHO2_01_FULL_66_17]|nr:MAG: hypothetical protein A2638_05230 [Nitrospirae bacterium RIFCSPHIGHO2_01_FULL_66_17]
MRRRQIHYRVVLISLLGVLLVQGCAYLQHETQEHPIAITERDAALLHPRSRYVSHHRHLSTEESRRINERLGHEATRPDELIGYYAVTRWPKRPTGETGTVFLEPVRTEHGTLSLLVSVKDGVPQRLAVKDGPSAAAVTHEFLDQFLGRDLDHSYEVGRDPDAFHRVPSPLAPIEGRWELSQRIAEAVRKILVIAEALGV